MKMSHPKPKLAKTLKKNQKQLPSASEAAAALNLLNGNSSGRTSNRISRPPPSSSLSKRCSKSNCIRSPTCTSKAGGGGSSPNATQTKKAERSGSTDNDRTKDVTGNDNTNTYDRLMLSLVSPFPNEHELALHTCLAFSTGGSGNGGKTTAAAEVNLLQANPAILNMLLAHVGFYHDCGLRAMMEEMFREALGVSFALFWEEVCGNNEGLQGLLCECYPGELGKLSEVEKGILYGFGGKEGDRCGEEEKSLQELQNVLKCCSGCNAPAELDKMNSPTTQLPMSLRMPENSEKLEKRVNLVGTIIRNFSFQSDDAMTLARNSTMLRFLLVSAQVEHGTLPNTAFDIASNIAKFVGGTTDNIAKQEDYMQLVFALANLMKTAVLNSGDRYKILRALEAVGGFAMSEDKQVVPLVTDLTLCLRVFQLLTVKQDISLVIAGLECLLAISESGREACDLIAEVQGSIQTLMSYMTLDFSEAKAASDQQLAKIQVVAAESESKSKASKFKANCTDSSQLTPSPTPEEGPPAPSPENATPVDDNINCLVTAEESHREKGILKNKHLSQPADAKNNPFHNIKGIQIFKMKMNGHISMITLAYDSKTGTYFRPDVYPYVCEWEGCQKRSKTKGELRWHVYQTHCSENLQNQKSYCRWALQNQNGNSACTMLRGRPSLLTHLTNHHCNDDALEEALQSQKNGMMKPSSSPTVSVHQEGANDPPSDPNFDKNPPSVLPAPSSSQIDQEGDEHVITKSTRLTAALTLRNLAKYSNNARRSLTRYESHLAEISLNDWDCAGVVAEVLHYVGLGLRTNEEGIVKNYDC